MCGIAGIFSTSGGLVLEDELRRMSSRLAPRGPDGEGVWLDTGEQVGFVHRRLAIIDLSDRGAQPMASADGSLVVTFNGEIYNYRTLRRGLEDDGFTFQSDSDTEVLLALYQRDGREMLRHLRGMYAFAIWDARARVLFAARDPLGIKPLYYSIQNGTVRFASQVKALLAGGAISSELDPAGIVGLFCFGSVPEPHTFIAAIKALPAGHYLSVRDDGRPKLTRYFNVAEVLRDSSEQAFDVSESDLQEYVSSSLHDSVRHHLVADVAVGAFLSSGVDSSALVGIMRDEKQLEIQTVTLTFSEFAGQQRDEGPVAGEVARTYRTQHCSRQVSPAALRAAAPSFLDAMDQPSVDGLNTYIVSRIAREAGLKVAISGLGGDELLGGYPSFRDVPRWVRTLRHLSTLPVVPELFRRSVSMVPSRLLPVSPKVAGLLQYGGTFPGAYFLKRGLFMPWELSTLLPLDFARTGLERLALEDHVAQAMTPDPLTPFGRVAALETALYMRNQLLRDSDWASMAHGLEVRVPLVDVELLRRLAPVLTGRTSLPGKRLLARCPRQPLPQAVLSRPKTGFEIPVGDLLNDPGLGLSAWKRVPSLTERSCHWSRRMAYALYKRAETGAWMS